MFISSRSVPRITSEFWSTVSIVRPLLTRWVLISATNMNTGSVLAVKNAFSSGTHRNLVSLEIYLAGYKNQFYNSKNSWWQTGATFIYLIICLLIYLFFVLILFIFIITVPQHSVTVVKTFSFFIHKLPLSLSLYIYIYIYISGLLEMVYIYIYMMPQFTMYMVE